MDYDIVIVGAGVSGIAAAITAANTGAKVALLEKETYLGGVATRAFHVTLCGFFYNDPTNSFKLLNEGLCSVITDDLIGSGVASKKEIGKTEVLQTYPSALSALFEGYLERTDVELILAANVIELETDKSRIISLTYQKSEREIKLRAKSFVDASGNAILAKLSNHSQIESKERQLAAICAKVIDVDTSDSLSSVITAYNIRKIVGEYGLYPEMAYSVVHGTHEGYLVLKISVDPSRDYGLVLKAANRLVATLAIKYPAWRDSKVLDWSGGIVLRDENRMLGKEVLEHHQVLAGYKSDGFVKAAWPIEFWHLDRGPRYEYIEQGDYYIIADDCMRSAFIDNLYAAGKSLSADSYALASSRVVGTAIATGERAALLALNKG